MQQPSHTKNIHDFDTVICGVSGGKDSTAALLWLLYESNVKRFRAFFCDTGNEDPLTYAFIEHLSREHCHIEVLKPDLDFYALAVHKGFFPWRKAQFCTQYLKIIPTQEYMLQLHAQDLKIARISGVRRAEGHASNDRATKQWWEFDDGSFVDVYHPLLTASLDDVWSYHTRYLDLDAVCTIVQNDPKLQEKYKHQIITRIRANGIPRNPLYDIGAKRVGCFPCVNSRKSEIKLMTMYRPEQVAFLSEQEIRVSAAAASGSASFFTANKVPTRYRTRVFPKNDGSVVMIPTINDVARWANIELDGQLTFFDDDDLADMPVSACDLGGYCE